MGGAAAVRAAVRHHRDVAAAVEAVDGRAAARLHVPPDLVADSAVERGEQRQRDEVDEHGEGGDVQLERPLRPELGAAVPQPAAAAGSGSQRAHAEDEELRDAEQCRQRPHAGRQHVQSTRRPRVVRHRSADGAVAVERREQKHVRRQVDDHHLHVGDGATERVPAAERKRRVPQHLRQDVEQGDQQIGDAEMLDEYVHPARLALTVAQRHEDAHVAGDGDGEDGRLQSHLGPRQVDVAAPGASIPPHPRAGARIPPHPRGVHRRRGVVHRRRQQRAPLAASRRKLIKICKMLTTSVKVAIE